jgi:hypothetical protein
MIKEPENPYQMTAMSNEQKELLLHQRNEELARNNLVEMQRLLQSSLIAQGKFDDAKKEGVKASEINPIKKAIALPDDKRCKCAEPQFIPQDDSKGGNKNGFYHYPQYENGIRVWSDQHQAMVVVQTCRVCGHQQATPEIKDAATPIT